MGKNWHRKYTRQYMGHNNSYHKKNPYKIMFWILIVIGLAWFLISIFPAEKQKIEDLFISNHNYSIVSNVKGFDIKDLNENPENYVGEKIKITAEYGGYSGLLIEECGSTNSLKSLVDKQGYRIWFCSLRDRIFEKDGVYTIEGEFIKTYPSNIPFDSEPIFVLVEK